MDEHWNRDYLLASDVLNRDNSINDATPANFFVGNTVRQVAAAARTFADAGSTLEKNGVASPRGLRRLDYGGPRTLAERHRDPALRSVPTSQAGFEREVSLNYHR